MNSKRLASSIAICLTLGCATVNNMKIDDLSISEILVDDDSFMTDEGCSHWTGYKPLKFDRLFDYKFRDGEYSLDYEDESLGTALVELSIQSKIPIIFDEEIRSKTVSVVAPKVSLIQALKLLTADVSVEYKYIDDGNYFLVGSIYSQFGGTRKSAVTSWSFNQTLSYKTRYIKPSELVETIPKDYERFLKINDASGLVVVEAPPKIIIKITRLIQVADVPRKQVVLRLNIYEIRKTGQNMLGKNLKSFTALEAGDVLAPALPIFSPTLLQGAAYRSFLSTMKTLISENEASIKAQPVLLTEEGVEANYETSTIYSPPTDGLKINTKDKSVATGLKITPHVMDENEIILEINDAHSSNFVYQQSVVSSHKVSTRVSTRPGQTVVLGGLMSSKKITYENKIPLLGDIPFLGWLFKSKQFEYEQVEVMFTITPSLVCGQMGHL